MEQLISKLDRIEPLEKQLKEDILSLLKTTTLPSREFLLREGETNRTISFIEKGLVRCYHDENDAERTNWIFKENDIIISVESFFLQQPSRENIQALENCTFQSITFDQLHLLCEKYRKFYKHKAQILLEYYLKSIERETMRQKNAFEKYKYLMEDPYQNKLVRRVQDKILASYLTMTPETFSYQKRMYKKRGKE